MVQELMNNNNINNVFNYFFYMSYYNHWNVRNEFLAIRQYFFIFARIHVLTIKYSSRSHAT